jgi:hypothetical protein
MTSEKLSKTRRADASDRHVHVGSGPGRRTVSSLKSTVFESFSEAIDLCHSFKKHKLLRIVPRQPAFATIRLLTVVDH